MMATHARAALAERAGAYEGALSAVADWLTAALALPPDQQSGEVEAIRDYVIGALDRAGKIGKGPGQ